MQRHRRRVAHARSDAQRMEVSERLQVAAIEAITSDPAAYYAFLARNHRKRRQTEVQRLLQHLTQDRIDLENLPEP